MTPLQLRTPAGHRAGQSGLTLIELLVAMVIGLIVTLAVTSVLTIGEAHKRSTTATNDMGQTGAYAVYQIDRAIRSAGSALIQSADAQGIFGCRLNARKSNAFILPRTTAFPEPFKDSFLTGTTADLRVAPLLIGKAEADSGSDVLVVMRGNGNAGGIPRTLKDPGTASVLVPQTTAGFAANDLILVSQKAAAGATTPECILTQVSSVTTTNLNLSGTYYASGTAGVGATKIDLSTLAVDTAGTFITPIGNAVGNSVQLQLFGVGANRTLFSYDLLQGGATDESQPMADGVVELHALYGLDTDNNGMLDSWVDPSGEYDISAVMASPTKIRQIIAVRLVLIMRSASQERDMVAPAKLTFFSALDAKNTLERELLLSDDDRHFRYRVVETTIPLRNMQLIPAPL